MKKTNLVKVVSILLVSLMVILFSTNVFAANNDDFKELDGNAALLTNNANKNNNTNNSRIYNNTDLPKTGVESSIPVVVLVAIFGISAVYAYKKIDDYKNL